MLKKFEEFLMINEARVPSNILEFSQRKGCTSTVKKIAKWIEKASGGKRQGISGGTAIGKYYDTLVLDVNYQGSEIYLYTDTDTIEFCHDTVDSYQDFKRIWDENEL